MCDKYSKEWFIHRHNEEQKTAQLPPSTVGGPQPVASFNTPGDETTNYVGPYVIDEFLSNTLDAGATKIDILDSDSKFLKSFFSMSCGVAIVENGGGIGGGNEEEYNKNHSRFRMNGCGKTGSPKEIGKYGKGHAENHKEIACSSFMMSRHKRDLDNHNNTVLFVRSDVGATECAMMHFCSTQSGMLQFATGMAPDIKAKFINYMKRWTPVREDILIALRDRFLPENTTGTVQFFFGLKREVTRTNIETRVRDMFYEDPGKVIDVTYNGESLDISYLCARGDTIGTREFAPHVSNGIYPTARRGDKTWPKKRVDVLDTIKDENNHPYKARVDVLHVNTPLYDAKNTATEYGPLVFVCGNQVRTIPMPRWLVSYWKMKRKHNVHEILIEMFKRRGHTSKTFNDMKKNNEGVDSERAFKSSILNYDVVVAFHIPAGLLDYTKSTPREDRKNQLSYLMLSGLQNALPILNTFSHGDAKSVFKFAWKYSCNTAFNDAHFQIADLKKPYYSQFLEQQREKQQPRAPRQRKPARAAGNEFTFAQPSSSEDRIHNAVAQPTAKRTREPAQGSDISHEDSNERPVHKQRTTSHPSKRARTKSGTDGAKSKRRHFTKNHYMTAITKQKNKCDNPYCRIQLAVSYADCDHKDGDSGNASEENCHWLCKPCHAVKTAQETKCRTENKPFHYDMMKSNCEWKNMHIAILSNLCAAQPKLSAEQRKVKKEILTKMLSEMQ